MGGTRADLVRRLVAVADDLTVIAAPRQVREQLVSVCRITRISLGAAAVSIARIEDDDLVFEAAEGHGADEIVGTRLSPARGLAGFVARTGQAIVIDGVQSDPRFARDVAERTGFVPTSMLVVPVTPTGDDPIGVLSVLDRGATTAGADALEVATAAADQAAGILPAVDAVVRLGPLLLRSLAQTVEAGDRDLGRALAREADRAGEPDAEMIRIAALLARLRAAPPDARARAERVLEDVVELATRRRR